MLDADGRAPVVILWAKSPEMKMHCFLAFHYFHVYGTYLVLDFKPFARFLSDSSSQFV